MSSGRNYADEKVRIGGYVVGIIDVLNQRDAIRQLSVLPKSEQERLEFRKKLRNSLGVRDFVRRQICKFVESYQAASPGPEITQLNAEQRVTFLRQRQCSVRTYLFSDTVAVFAPVLNDSNEVSGRAFYSVLAACGVAMLTCLAEGIPVRGAVELGVGLPCENNEIYGPAFLNAYELEQRVAEYPRVVVGPVVCEHLTTLANLAPTEPTSVLLRQAAQLCQSLLSTDDDGKSIVDYLGSGMRAALGGTADQILVKKGYAFVMREHERFCTCGDAKLAPRYSRLRQFYENRIDGWGIGRM